MTHIDFHHNQWCINRYRCSHFKQIARIHSPLQQDLSSSLLLEWHLARSSCMTQLALFPKILFVEKWFNNSLISSLIWYRILSIRFADLVHSNTLVLASAVFYFLEAGELFAVFLFLLFQIFGFTRAALRPGTIKSQQSSRLASQSIGG